MRFDKPTATLAKPYWWVYHKDPAFNPEAEGFSETALDEALESQQTPRIDAWVKPGRKGPARFEMRHLSASTIRAVFGFAEQHGWALAFQRLCAMALLSIDNPDGKPVQLKQAHRDPTFSEPCLPEDTMEMLEYAGTDEGLAKGELVTAIGARALRSGKPSGN